MPRHLRVSLGIVTTLVLLALFFALYASIYVRGAISDGALAYDERLCLSDRDMARYHAGPDQQLADYWIDRRIRAYHHANRQRGFWHWYGLVTWAGLAITTSPEDRLDLSYASMAGLRTCGQPASSRNQPTV